MNGTLTLSKASLVKLLDAVLYPNPDDPGDPNSPWGPYGPIGPVLRRWWWVMLNPQPLPPVAGPGPQPWRLGPVPDPWRSAWLARLVIDQTVVRYQLAEVVAGTDQSERMLDTIR